jgi:uroporphyrinogen-III decarboxylase
MAAVRQAVGKKMVLCGGMNKHFWDYSPDRQAEHLRAVVAEGRKLGPHILMDSAGVAGNVTKENFDGFLKMSREIRAARK